MSKENQILVSKILNQKTYAELAEISPHIGADFTDNDVGYIFQILWRPHPHDSMCVGFYEEAEVILEKIEKYEKFKNFK